MQNRTGEAPIDKGQIECLPIDADQIELLLLTRRRKSAHRDATSTRKVMRARECVGHTLTPLTTTTTIETVSPASRHLSPPTTSLATRPSPQLSSSLPPPSSHQAYNRLQLPPHALPLHLSLPRLVELMTRVPTQQLLGMPRVISLWPMFYFLKVLRNKSGFTVLSDWARFNMLRVLISSIFCCIPSCMLLSLLQVNGSNVISHAASYVSLVNLLMGIEFVEPSHSCNLTRSSNYPFLMFF